MEEQEVGFRYFTFDRLMLAMRTCYLLTTVRAGAPFLPSMIMFGASSEMKQIFHRNMVINMTS